MILSNLELNGDLVLNSAGEDKAVIMTTDGNKIPYSAYYDMPDGYVSWLQIIVTDNNFLFRGEDNTFGDDDREVNVRFWCLDTFGGTPVPRVVKATQAVGGLSIAFTPDTVSLDIAGNTESVAVAGVPMGAMLELSSPTWVRAQVISNALINVSADVNSNNAVRSDTIYASVDGRFFMLPVNQAANNVSLSFDVDHVSLDYLGDDPAVVNITGIPVGVDATVSGPDWVKLTIDSGTGVLSVSAKKNQGGTVRSGKISISVYGKSFDLDVSQSANPSPLGDLVMNTTSISAPSSGGTFRVVAIELPIGQTEVTVKRIGPQGCVACGDTHAVIAVNKRSETVFDIVVQPQDIFGGDAADYDVVFASGDATAIISISQEAAAKSYRLLATADKFVKRAASKQEPSYLLDSATQNVYTDLLSAGWSAVSAPVASKLISGTPDLIITNPDAIEAYKANFARSEESGTTYQRVSMGVSAYRLAFSPGAVGQTIDALRVSIRADAYCVEGVRIALEIVQDGRDAPSSDWDVIREGSKHFAGVARRRLDSDASLYYGTSYYAVFDDLNITLTSDTRIFVYLSMEDYKAKYNGWLYGSAVVSQRFEIASQTLIPALEEGEKITEEGLAEKHSSFYVVRDFIVAAPKPAEQNATMTREILYRDIGVGDAKTAPTEDVTSAALSALFVDCTRRGMNALSFADVEYDIWPTEQVGLSVFLERFATNSVSDKMDTLRYSMTPMLISAFMPKGTIMSRLIIKHTSSMADVSLSNTRVNLTAYWFPEYALQLADIGVFASLKDFVNAPSKLTVDKLGAGNKIGEIQLPDVISGDVDLMMPVSGNNKNWGTIMLLPNIAGVWSMTIPRGYAVGLVGPRFSNGVVSGTAWCPDVVVEV